MRLNDMFGGIHGFVRACNQWRRVRSTKQRQREAREKAERVSLILVHTHSLIHPLSSLPHPLLIPLSPHLTHTSLTSHKHPSHTPSHHQERKAAEEKEDDDWSDDDDDDDDDDEFDDDFEEDEPARWGSLTITPPSQSSSHPLSPKL